MNETKEGFMPMSEMPEAIHMWMNRKAIEAQHLAEKRELSQKIAQMECSTFEMERIIGSLEGRLLARDAAIRALQKERDEAIVRATTSEHRLDTVYKVYGASLETLRQKYEFSQKCIKQLEEEIRNKGQKDNPPKNLKVVALECFIEFIDGPASIEQIRINRETDPEKYDTLTIRRSRA